MPKRKPGRPRKVGRPKAKTTKGGARKRPTNGTRSQKRRTPSRRTARRTAATTQLIMVPVSPGLQGGAWYNDLWSGVKSAGRFVQKNKLGTKAAKVAEALGVANADKALKVAKILGVGHPRGAGLRVAGARSRGRGLRTAGGAYKHKRRVGRPKKSRTHK